MAFIHSILIFSVALFFGFEPLTAQDYHSHPHSHHTDSAGEKVLESGNISELGIAEVTPDIGVVGNFGTWTVTYTVGSFGLQKGGGLKVQFPDPWHFGERNSAVHLQATNPKGDYFVSAQSPEAGTRFETVVESEAEQSHLIKQYRRGIENRGGRYVYVVHITLAEGQLKEGDIVTVTYGDTSEGGRGMRAAKIVTPPTPVKLAVDSNGDGEFKLHPNPPLIQTRSESLSKIRLTGPSSPVTGNPSKLHLAFLDKYNNPVDSFKGRVEFEIVQGKTNELEAVELDIDKGWTTVDFIPVESGILRVKASALNDIYTASSNVMKVAESEEDFKTYWGDLHSHSGYSEDGVGTESFNYARNVTRLDFYALTDHTSQPDNEGYTRSLWYDIYDEYTALTEKYYDPGNFVTIHAMEVSFGTPWGHHNLYYRGDPKGLYSPDIEDFSLPKLWEQLEAGQALTIPHHTAKMARDITWFPNDPELRRNFEIYSAHGLSEEYNPGHPLAAGSSDFTFPGTPHMLPQYGQDAWMHGLKLSTIAASDDHVSQPGKPHFGLTAVQATGLTREEIFDALYERRTYGTTGERILVDFQVNGAPMGQKILSKSFPLLEIGVHGTDDIEWVEVLRFTEFAGNFEVIHRFYPNTKDFKWSKVDYGFSDDAIYYIRLKQAGFIEDRDIMAWSSPVWVENGMN